MDDMTRFEDRFEDRVRAFAKTGVRPVDSAAVAHAIAIGNPSRHAASAMRWPGLSIHRRAWVIALAIGLLVTLLGGALLVWARLFRPPPSPLDSRQVRLVYALDDDIYVADPDGANPIRIADGDANAACGGFRGNVGLVSPDGRHIAYRSGGSGGCPATIVIADQDGHPVASFPGLGLGHRVVARRHSYWHLDRWRRAADRHLRDLYGTRQAVLDGSRTCCGDYDPGWSPHGSSLLIPTHDPVPGSMWELPVDGGAPRRVLDDDTRSHRGAVYSDDGARVAFVPWEDSELLVIAESGGTELRVLPGANVDPELGRRKGSITRTPSGPRRVTRSPTAGAAAVRTSRPPARPISPRSCAWSTWRLGP